MPSMDIEIELCLGSTSVGDVTLSVDFTYRAGERPHMGSLTYPGDPGSLPEVEIETIFWPIERWDSEKKARIRDHIVMPYSGLPLAVAEAIEAHIIEHYDESDDYEDER